MTTVDVSFACRLLYERRQATSGQVPDDLNEGGGGKGRKGNAFDDEK